MAKKIAGELMDDDVFEEDDYPDDSLSQYTSPKDILIEFFRKYNDIKKLTGENTDKIVKSALLNTIRDGYGINNYEEYIILKKLLDNLNIGITLPDKIDVQVGGVIYDSYIIVYRENSICIVDKTCHEIGKVYNGTFNENYYSSHVDYIDLENVFYTPIKSKK